MEKNVIDNLSNFDLTPEEIKYYQVIKRKRITSIVLKVVIYVVLSLWALLAIFPVLWAFLSSFKNRADVVLEPFSFPGSLGWTGENYKAIFTGSLNIFTAYMWSLLISGGVVILTILSAVLAAFVLARYKFRGKIVVSTIVIGCMMFPSFSLVVPIVKILNSIGLHNSPMGVILPQVALNLGFTITLLVGFFQGLPIEVEESAFMDGASVPRVLMQIVVPMAKSAIVTCVIFIFLWSYNDLFMQKIVIQSHKYYPISMLLDMLNDREKGFNGGRMAAASTMVCIPLIIVYCIFQRHIIKGLTAGAVKG